jgi:hypothetical protein
VGVSRAAQRNQERKHFFSEEKKQKTFILRRSTQKKTLYREAGEGGAQPEGLGG